ncbi:ABC transporter permease [Deefgea salmonis]|uniref:MlaE family lipid ABC transporter permease subunit n=1 Tax=Deefgea salmonis TaxID=2875502 RepID=A0ABS8BKT2_9NEIS|nr:MlaE family lipid ABC transporter permease subunit [Deefgea salmonis]MCB5196332.1 MlaE family lipid ABC transporter permease subunit [Deefgea salmonis]
MPLTEAQLRPTTATHFELGGDLTLATSSALWLRIQQQQWAETEIDASAVQSIDGAGAALLFELQQRGARILALPAQGQRLLNALSPELPLLKPTPQPAQHLITRFGSRVRAANANFYLQISFLGAICAALWQSLHALRRFRWREFGLQCELVGANAVPIITLISILFGVILAFQSAIPMRQFGAELYVANLLGLSLIRELGPLITAILLAGRTGAAFAAELGTMKVNEEINALVTFGFDPIRFLVLPRLLAGVLMAPLLTLFAEVVGLFGGALVMKGFGIPFATYYSQIAGQVNLIDLLSGLSKAAIFGFIVAAVGCYRGLAAGNGASAVGAATTQAVVQILVLLVVADGLFAVVAYHMGW